MSFASRCDPSFPPALAAVARTATKFSSLLPDLRTDLDLATFATTSPRHLQHIITQAAESALLASAVAAANFNPPDNAHFNGGCGRWIQASRVCFSAASGVSQQLTCDEAKLRMQNYLRQPLSVLAPYVGKTTPGHSTNGAAIVVDELGDNLGGYHAPEDAEWIWFHNALRDCLRACAQCSGITTGIEKRARRPVGDESDGAAASNGAAESDGSSGDLRARRVKNTVPGDLELRGSHGYIPAGPNKVWADLVIATGTSPLHAVEAARIEGGAAQRAADAKHTKHDQCALRRRCLRGRKLHVTPGAQPPPRLLQEANRPRRRGRLCQERLVQLLC